MLFAQGIVDAQADKMVMKTYKVLSSFTSSLRERVEEEPPALPFSTFRSALRRHGSSSTSGVVGLGHTETGFQGG